MAKKKINKKTKKTSKKKSKKVFKKTPKKKMKKVVKKKELKKRKTISLIVKKTKHWTKKKGLNLENTAFSFLLIFSLIFGSFIWSAGRDFKLAEVPTNTKQNLPSDFELTIKEMVGGYPIERMAPFIAKQNNEVAKYLVAIAKKESNWGKFSPQKDGRDCFNYWGYRGTYNQTDSGYSCFDSPRQAVNVVGERIGELLAQSVQTPAEMIVWKCGASCDGHGDENVQKWIDDVGYYYAKL